MKMREEGREMQRVPACLSVGAEEETCIWRGRGKPSCRRNPPAHLHAVQLMLQSLWGGMVIHSLTASLCLLSDHACACLPGSRLLGNTL